ncbi:hypothetical protein ACHQM5_021939 [Ranunculus cassubicifolius]
MPPQSGRDSLCPSSRSSIDFENDLDFPFGKIDGLDRDDLRETAYEIFFTSCRSSPGFGGRNVLSYYPSVQDSGDGIGNSNGSGGNNNGRQGLMGTSRIKRMLGLKTAKKLQCSSRRSLSGGSGTSKPSSPSSIGSPRSVGSCSSPTHGAGFAFGATVPPSGATRLKRPMTSAEIMRQQMKVSDQSDNRLRKTLMRTLVGRYDSLFILFIIMR